MAKQFIYKGTLRDVSVPDALATINYHQVPGILQFSKSTVVKKVFFINGEVVFAYSNQVEDRLGEILLREGLITGEQHRESVSILEKSGGQKKHGQILVELGFLTPKRLFVEVKRQVEAIIYSLFEWDEGSVQFVCGPYNHSEIIMLNIKTSLLIYQGIKKIFNQNDIKKTLKSIKRPLTPTPRFKELKNNHHLTPYENKILSLIDGEMIIEKVCTQSPIGTLETLKFLCYLIVARYVE